MKYIVKFLRKEQIAEKTFQFYFEKPKDFEFQAGQTIDITLLNPPQTDKDGNTRPFSIVSAPHEKELAIATRIRESSFKNTLLNAKAGYEVEIDGPFGSFTLHENTKKPAIILVGGIGITPFVSMIKDVVYRNLPHKIYLFYSNRTPDDAPFLSFLEEIRQKNKNFTLVNTMTSKDVSDNWKGERGHISKEMLTMHAPKQKNAIYYSAGPQNMVKEMRNLLNSIGVSNDDIRAEEFSGY